MRLLSPSDVTVLALGIALFKEGSKSPEAFLSLRSLLWAGIVRKYMAFLGMSELVNPFPSYVIALGIGLALL